eukprot:gene22685-28833_t
MTSVIDYTSLRRQALLNYLSQLIEEVQDISMSAYDSQQTSTLGSNKSLASHSEWQSTYQSEGTMFDSVAVFAEIRLIELREREAHHGATPTKLKATVVADLLLRLCEKIEEHCVILPTLIFELLNCVFSEYANSTGCFTTKQNLSSFQALHTFFDRYNDVADQIEELQQEIDWIRQGQQMKEIVKKFQVMRLVFNTSDRFLRDTCFNLWKSIYTRSEYYRHFCIKKVLKNCFAQFKKYAARMKIHKNALVEDDDEEQYLNELNKKKNQLNELQLLLDKQNREEEANQRRLEQQQNKAENFYPTLQASAPRGIQRENSKKSLFRQNSSKSMNLESTAEEENEVKEKAAQALAAAAEAKQLAFDLQNKPMSPLQRSFMNSPKGSPKSTKSKSMSPYSNSLSRQDSFGFSKEGGGGGGRIGPILEDRSQSSSLDSLLNDPSALQEQINRLAESIMHPTKNEITQTPDEWMTSINESPGILDLDNIILNSKQSANLQLIYPTSQTPTSNSTRERGDQTVPSLSGPTNGGHTGRKSVNNSGTTTARKSFHVSSGSGTPRKEGTPRSLIESATTRGRARTASGAGGEIEGGSLLQASIAEGVIGMHFSSPRNSFRKMPADQMTTLATALPIAPIIQAGPALNLTPRTAKTSPVLNTVSAVNTPSTNTTVANNNTVTANITAANNTSTTNTPTTASTLSIPPPIITTLEAAPPITTIITEEPAVHNSGVKYHLTDSMAGQLISYVYSSMFLEDGASEVAVDFAPHTHSLLGYMKELFIYKYGIKNLADKFYKGMLSYCLSHSKNNPRAQLFTELCGISGATLTTIAFNVHRYKLFVKMLGVLFKGDARMIRSTMNSERQDIIRHDVLLALPLIIPTIERHEPELYNAFVQDLYSMKITNPEQKDPHLYRVNVDLLLAVLMDYAELEQKEKIQSSKSHLKKMGSVQANIASPKVAVQMIGGLKIEQVA